MTIFSSGRQDSTKKQPDTSDLQRELSLIRQFASEVTAGSERRTAEMRDLNRRMQQALADSRKAVP